MMYKNKLCINKEEIKLKSCMILMLKIFIYILYNIEEFNRN